MGKKLLSLGAIAMDIVINSHDLPKDDGFALINHEQMLPGGSASNVSVSAAHFGMESYQTGKIGDDNIGDEFLRTLREDGVDAELVAVKKGGTTLHTYILTAPGGQTLHLCEYRGYGLHADTGRTAGRDYGLHGHFL
ncbi:MAG: carbohydrate kinase family protein [[Clostridium] scindens]